MNADLQGKNPVLKLDLFCQEISPNCCFILITEFPIHISVLNSIKATQIVPATKFHAMLRLFHTGKICTQETNTNNSFTCHLIRSATKGYWFIKDVLPTLAMYQSTKHENVSINILKIIYIVHEFVLVWEWERGIERETRCRREWWLWEAHGDETPLKLRTLQPLNWDENQGNFGALFFTSGETKFWNKCVLPYRMYDTKILLFNPFFLVKTEKLCFSFGPTFNGNSHSQHFFENLGWVSFCVKIEIILW